jgi:hypothetical protein
MQKQFCDKCGDDITQQRSAAVNVIADADANGSGTVTTQTDLCRRCHRALLKWLSEADQKRRR